MQRARTSAATEKVMQPHRNIIKLFLIPSRFSGKQRTYFFSPNTTPDIRTETSLRTWLFIDPEVVATESRSVDDRQNFVSISSSIFFSF